MMLGTWDGYPSRLLQWPGSARALLDGKTTRHIAICFCLFAELVIALVEGADLFLGKVLHVDQKIAGSANGSQNLIELDLHGQGVFVLGTLQEENHQKGHDAADGVHHQLPGIRIVKQWT